MLEKAFRQLLAEPRRYPGLMDDNKRLRVHDWVRQVLQRGGMRVVGDHVPFDRRLIVNGYLPEYAYRCVRWIRFRRYGRPG
jgi:hypothetical protein